MSMPNWVPQSPTWLSLITRCPANSRTRAMASPTIVVRKCPTCISLATFGEEYSTTTVCGVAAGASPSRSSPSICVAWAAIQSSRRVKLMKPGPLTSGSAHMSATSSRAAEEVAAAAGRPARAEPLGDLLRDLAAGQVGREQAGGGDGAGGARAVRDHHGPAQAEQDGPAVALRVQPRGQLPQPAALQERADTGGPGRGHRGAELGGGEPDRALQRLQRHV